MIRAGIDIGTNTILLLVAEVENHQVQRVLEDHVRVVRLGQGVDKNRAFHPDAIERARQCFAEYAEILKKYPGVPLKAAATSGSRDARNSAEFFAEVKAKFGISVDVISGDEEALYSFRGALPAGAMDPAKIAVVDIGGGSTEIVGLEADQKLFRYSFEIGCVRLGERYLLSDPATEEQKQNLLTFIRGEFAKQQHLLKKLPSKKLIGVAGTATYLASTKLELAKFDPELVHGAKLSLADIDGLVKSLAPLTAAQRLGLGGMDKGRADVIVAGALILRELLVTAEVSEIQISVRGLRYGLVLE